MATKSNEDEYYEKLYENFDPTKSDLSSATSSGRRGRDTVLPWEDYFMALAFLAGKRSKDPKTKVGAVIVRGMNCKKVGKLHTRKKIVGIGYNAMPVGCDESELPGWGHKSIGEYGWKETKYPYVCHAAINAILNSNAEDLNGCTLFTTLLPAHEDAKLMIQSGITEVVYYEDRRRMYSHIARKMFDKTKIKCKDFMLYQEECKKLRIKECKKHATRFLKRSRGKRVKEEDRIRYEEIARQYEKDAEKERNRKHDNISVYPRPRPADDPTPSKCTSEPLTDKDYYMGIACLSARRSKDPSTQVGACIVDEGGNVVGIGYNGWPYNISDDDPDVSWEKKGEGPVQCKHPYVVHAEANAIMHKTCISLKGCTIYTTLFPCNECAKLIIQSGITKVYYLDDKDKISFQASRRLLSSAGYHSTSDLHDKQPLKVSKVPVTAKVCDKYEMKTSVQIQWPRKRAQLDEGPAAKRRLKM